MAPPRTHPWEFTRRFRRNAFGWRSQPAVQRVREAVREITGAARTDPVLAADGAVSFLERISQALEHVDGSSGAIGAAVNGAVAQLVPLIAAAPADAATRERWLERLWTAHEADDMPYIESLADHWGTMCASPALASRWADRLLGVTREALRPNSKSRLFLHGTSACLSALHAAGRNAELVELLRVDAIWPYKEWAVRALAAMGETDEAIRYAEACRGPWTNDASVDACCEEILFASGRIDEAYSRYGVRVRRGGTFLATFRALAKRYPHRKKDEILRDLAATTPGDEGKWFAAAKDAGLYDEALALAARSPCDPRTLARAARDYADRRPAFALEAGMLAIRWLLAGHGYEITSADVRLAFTSAMRAAGTLGVAAQGRDRLRALLGEGGPGSAFVEQVIGHELGRG